MAAGTWTPVAKNAPNGVETMLLLSDGSVMAQNNESNIWYRLMPDIHGSYVNGIWSTLTPMHDTRLYYSSDVLRDGRVFVAGGEYGTGTNTAEVYDPLSNTWTLAPPSGQLFYDSISVILSNGNVMIAPVYPSPYGSTIFYNPTSNTWLAGPQLVRGGDQDEASWVKLPDNSILTVDPFGANSERYIPSLNQWVDDGIVPVYLYDTNDELGAGLLLPDGQAFYLGGTGHTAIYAPSGSASPGTWAAGPDIPAGLGAPDAPAAMMVNGRILCALGPAQTYDGPTSFYEYDPVANSFTSVNGPTGATYDMLPYATRMLDLPDGTVLFAAYNSQLYVYQPSGSPLAAGKPTIGSITQNTDGSYLLTGTLLNGICAGAAYGDDAQMDSNYPIIRMTDAAGRVYYARTYNWSSTGVMTGNTPVTTQFTVPAGLSAGTYSLVVVANGISSDPVSFIMPASVFRITGITKQSNDLLVTWQVPAGSINVVQVTGGSANGGYSNNFANLSPAINVGGVSGLVTTNYLDAGGATNAPSRFYRVKTTAPLAADNAFQTAYGGGWTNGSNTGFGFGPWVLTDTAPLNPSLNGFFLGSSTGNAGDSAPGIDANGYSWGIYANSGNNAAAYRAFANGSLQVGQSFLINMDNGYISGSSTVGFVLRTGNASSSPSDYNNGARFEFKYIGSDSVDSYKVVDNGGQQNIGVPFTGTGLRLKFTLTGTNAYTLATINNASGATNIFSGTLGGTVNGTVDSLAIYNLNAGTGSDYDAFFNSLQVVGP